MCLYIYCLLTACLSACILHVYTDKHNTHCEHVLLGVEQHPIALARVCVYAGKGVLEAVSSTTRSEMQALFIPSIVSESQQWLLFDKCSG